MTALARLGRAASADLAIAAATAFIALAAVGALAFDPRDGAPDWRLRSTLAPFDGVPASAPLPADRKPV